MKGKHVELPARVWDDLHKIAAWVEATPDWVGDFALTEGQFDQIQEHYATALARDLPDGVEVFDVETGRGGTLWAVVDEQVAGKDEYRERRIRLVRRGGPPRPREERWVARGVAQLRREMDGRRRAQNRG